MKTLALAIVAVCLLGPVARAQQNPLTGTWKVITIALPNQPRITAPQPGLYIFTPKYYSVVRINSDKPPANADTLTAQSGTYTVVGNRLRIHPIASINPGDISGPETEYEFDISSQTMVLTSHPPDRSTPEVVILSRVEY
jgi:hypothetical protein